MNPHERRRIAWGPGEHANLDPFVVDVFGRVFNGSSNEPLTALTPRDAAKAWNRHGDGSKSRTVDPDAPRGLGGRLPSLKPNDLVRGWSDVLVIDTTSGETTPVRNTVTRWLFTSRRFPSEAVWRDRTKPPPVVVADEPPDWVPLAGNPVDGWIEVAIERRFVSVLHGPSLAAWLRLRDSSST